MDAHHRRAEEVSEDAAFILHAFLSDDKLISHVKKKVLLLKQQKQFDKEGGKVDNVENLKEMVNRAIDMTMSEIGIHDLIRAYFKGRKKAAQSMPLKSSPGSRKTHHPDHFSPDRHSLDHHHRDHHHVDLQQTRSPDHHADHFSLQSPPTSPSTGSRKSYGSHFSERDHHQSLNEKSNHLLLPTKQFPKEKGEGTVDFNKTYRFSVEDFRNQNPASNSLVEYDCDYDEIGGPQSFATSPKIEGTTHAAIMKAKSSSTSQRYFHETDDPAEQEDLRSPHEEEDMEDDLYYKNEFDDIIASPEAHYDVSHDPSDEITRPLHSAGNANSSPTDHVLKKDSFEASNGKYAPTGSEINLDAPNEELVPTGKVINTTYTEKPVEVQPPLGDVLKRDSFEAEDEDEDESITNDTEANGRKSDSNDKETLVQPMQSESSTNRFEEQSVTDEEHEDEAEHEEAQPEAEEEAVHEQDYDHDHDYSNDFEEAAPEQEARRGVYFPEDVVSSTVYHRMKYQPEEAADLFYTQEESMQFQYDYDREMNRAEEADLKWYDWIMGRSEEQLLADEEEDAALREEAYNSYWETDQLSDEDSNEFF